MISGGEIALDSSCFSVVHTRGIVRVTHVSQDAWHEAMGKRLE